MHIVNRVRQRLEQWREGAATISLVPAAGGSTQPGIFEQVSLPCHGASACKHAVEEALEVKEGCAEILVGAGSDIVGASQSVPIPAGVSHSFRNSGGTTLRLRATLASPPFEAIHDPAYEISRGRFGRFPAACD